MANRIEPDRSWSDDIDLTADNWRKIRGFFDKDLSDSDAKRINYSISDYYSEYCSGVFSISSGSALKKLKKIINLSDGLLEYISIFDISIERHEETGVVSCIEFDSCDEIDVHVRNLVRDGLLNPENVSIFRIIQRIREDIDDGGGNNYLRKMTLSLHLFRGVIFEAINDIESSMDGPGSCGDKITTDFLLEAYEIFCDISNSKVISKNFLGFSSYILEIIAEKSKHDFGKGVKMRSMSPSAIRRRIEERRASSAPLGRAENS